MAQRTRSRGSPWGARRSGFTRPCRIPLPSCKRDTENRKKSGEAILPSERAFNPLLPWNLRPLPDGTPVPTRVPGLLTQGKKQRPSHWPGARWRGWEVAHTAWLGQAVGLIQAPGPQGLGQSAQQLKPNCLPEPCSFPSYLL